MVRTRSNKILAETNGPKKNSKKKNATKLHEKKKIELSSVVIPLNRDPLINSALSDSKQQHEKYRVYERKLRSGLKATIEKPMSELRCEKRQENERELRHSSKPTIAKPASKPTAMNRPKCPTLQNAIDASFEKLKKTFAGTKKQPNVGDFMLARMRGYAPWPSKITDFTKDRKRAKCYFYGSHNNGSVDVNQIVPFADAYELIRLINMRKPVDFAKGVKEVEIENGISHELSSLRELQTIQ